MEKIMNNSKKYNVMSKLAADALQAMLAAERISTVNLNKRGRRVVIAADGVKLPYAMKGWGKGTWRQSEDGVIYKYCKGCYKWFPLSEFPVLEEKHNTSHDGRSQYCAKCKSKKSIEDANAGKEFRVKLDNSITARVLSDYTDAELLRELRNRGYKGELTYTKTVAV